MVEVVEVIKVVEHCVRHCTLMMVCGIVLGKAKTTKVGMVWYEFNIVNQSINDKGRYRAVRAAKKFVSNFLKSGKNCIVMVSYGLVSRTMEFIQKTWRLYTVLNNLHIP